MTDVAGGDRREGRDGRDGRDARGSSPALLTRLNARGFRLSQGLDAAVLVLVLVGSMWVRHRWSWPTYSMGRYAFSFSLAILLFLAALYFGGLYDREARLGRPNVLPRALRLTGAAGGIFAVTNLAITGALQSSGSLARNLQALPMPVTSLVTLVIVGALGVTLNRELTARNEMRVLGPPKVLLVGDDVELAKAKDHLDLDDEATVVGHVETLEGLTDAVTESGATDVILLSGRWLGAIETETLRRLDRRDVAIHQRVTAQETMYGLQRVRQIGGMPFVRLRANTMPTSRLRFKRFLDLVWLVVLSPVLLGGLVFGAVWTAVLAGRPVLYWQDRVGVGGQVFRLVKFRTMRPDAEATGGAQLSTKEDPRVIPACRWMRATRVDELPQLWNILRGEMSLVGPRPERPELTAEFDAVIPGYARRHELPPGLTGLAQIHGRYHTDPEYKLGYDLQYLVNWSPVLDVQIVLQTVWVVLARRV